MISCTSSGRTARRSICLPPLLLLLCVAFSESLAMESAIVSPCARCAVTSGAMWCPSDMTCHTTDPCHCAEPCLRFADCFTQETDCRGCVSSGGVYCTADSPTWGRRCFFPNVTPVSRGMDGDISPRCADVCVAIGGRCLESVAECPARRDSFLIGWLASMSLLAVGCLTLSGMVICRGVRNKYEDRKSSMHQQG